MQENRFIDVSSTSNPNNDQPKDRSFLSYLRDWIYIIALVILVFSLVFRMVIVSGSSMKNTLLDGDWILLLSNTLYWNPEPGDIIVASKDAFEDGKPIIKRIIATEGQTVDIRDKVVYVDDVPLDEPYTLTDTDVRDITFPIVVDTGCYFVMGDNRDASLDSRSSQIGLVDKGEMMGKAIFLLFPGNGKGEADRDLRRIGVIS
jgi:signal peptidase I